MNELAVGAIVDYRYDLALVALSFLISVLGSYVALTLASAPDRGQSKIVGAAVALGGCGIWSMHFIGMIAYKTVLPVSFGFLPTMVSLVIAILLTAAGLRIALGGPRKMSNLVFGGAVVGGGVVVMHYMGMFGMDLRAAIEWNWAVVAGSVLIAVVAATVALWLAVNVKTTTHRVAAALVMGVAVCAMHYTGMAAATLICVTSVARGAYSLDGPYLAFLVFGFSVVLLGFSIAYSKIGMTQASPA